MTASPALLPHILMIIGASARLIRRRNCPDAVTCTGASPIHTVHPASSLLRDPEYVIKHDQDAIMASVPPSTPKRTNSSASTSSMSSDVSSRLSRNAAPNNLLASTHKRYKAPLSVESRSKNFTKTKSVLSSVPGTPTKRSGTPSTSRPQTPASPRKGAESPSLLPATSEMDVSIVDIESVLVDYQMVEEADVSGEIDDAWLQAAMNDHGKHDKVMVSIR
ncbi:hypothetical protein NP233_g11815 [Leucocoprinus birnbaumii]|uniref:Uncharacterized protein n=1 Tax=Leucocoprinus birnbaumii TaxID=56174 RepID=A0AAD5YQK2_9AGAR|nr:hypothetical protein NP233_g11815 [Leucocoprinus birnbaumii]